MPDERWISEYSNTFAELLFALRHVLDNVGYTYTQEQREKKERISYGIANLITVVQEPDTLFQPLKKVMKTPEELAEMWLELFAWMAGNPLSYGLNLTRALQDWLESTIGLFYSDDQALQEPNEKIGETLMYYLQLFLQILRVANKSSSFAKALGLSLKHLGITQNELIEQIDGLLYKP